MQSSSARRFLLSRPPPPAVKVKVAQDKFVDVWCWHCWWCWWWRIGLVMMERVKPAVRYGGTSGGKKVYFSTPAGWNMLIRRRTVPASTLLAALQSTIILIRRWLPLTQIYSHDGRIFCQVTSSYNESSRSLASIIVVINWSDHVIFTDI